MEAFTALGVAVNIAQVIDYGFKIIQKSRDLRERGVTDPALNDDAQRLHKLTTDLISQGSSKCSGSLRGLAIECAKVSQALIIELKKLQPSDPKSKLQRAKAIWERKFKEGLIAELERRLQDHKGQLSLHLTSLSRIEFNDKLDEINLDMRGMKSELTAMHLAAKELINSDHIGQAISEALRPLIQQYNDYLCQWSELVILDMLHFPDMHERFDTIPDAHRETLHWLLSATHDKHSIKTKANNDSVTWLGQEITPDKETLHWLLNTTTDEHSIRNKASNDFITWLRQGSGFFHISGKPGSGKSTMMKYVCSHHGLEDHLNVWCHDAQLCLGQFFFWKPGSLAQKSIKGLLRGLLYSILDKNRNLIPTVFPNLWKRILHTRSSTSRQLEYRDFQQGFDNLLKYALDSGSYKFVLFIDGLDEFEGQHLDLITTMKEWTEKYPLKICVSSREYGVFLQSFLSYPKLRLHECNFVDIERMTSARLKSNPLCADLFDSDEVLQKIVDLITTRADGVFIWVSIVLAGLEDAMISGASLPELLERIDAYPRELDNLYWHLVHLIHETDRRWAFRVLKMVHFSKSQWKLFTRTALRNISLLQLSFLDDIQYDITAGFPKASALHPESISRRLENTYKKVYGRCKGFLDVIQDHNSYVPRAMAPQVVLTHRSLVEFLETPSFIEEARPYISDSDCFSNVCGTMLRCFEYQELVPDVFNHRILGDTNFREDFIKPYWADIFDVFLQLACKSQPIMPNMVLHCLEAFRDHILELSRRVEDQPFIVLWTIQYFSLIGLKFGVTEPWKREKFPLARHEQSSGFIRMLLQSYVNENFTSRGSSTTEDQFIDVLDCFLSVGTSFETIIGFDSSDLPMWKGILLSFMTDLSPQAWCPGIVMDWCLRHGADPDLTIGEIVPGGPHSLQWLGPNNEWQLIWVSSRSWSFHDFARKTVDGCLFFMNETSPLCQIIIGNGGVLKLKDLLSYWFPGDEYFPDLIDKILSGKVEEHSSFTFPAMAGGAPRKIIRQILKTDYKMYELHDFHKILESKGIEAIKVDG